MEPGQEKLPKAAKKTLMRPNLIQSGGMALLLLPSKRRGKLKHYFIGQQNQQYLISTTTHMSELRIKIPSQ